MKSKLHNITVNNQSYVFWYSSGKRFVLNISPKENKNIQIQLVFKFNAPDNDPYTFWAFYEIKGVKDSCETKISLTKPKIIAEIISFINCYKRDLFSTPKTHVIDEAIDLINDMGYTELEPIWVGEW